MEHNLAGHAKYYSCGCIEISRSSEFARETDHNRRDFSDIGKQMLKTSYTLNLRKLLKITHEVKKKYLVEAKTKENLECK
jgi:hypothetical protein